MRPNKQTRTVYWVLAATAIGAALWRAWSLRWVCDDVFITLRYIQNFLDGKGLVFNAGEYVEGYTHFLWLWVIALFQWIGFDPVGVSMTAGLVAFGGVLGSWAGVSWKAGKPKGAWIPFTTLALALSYDTAVWATGGLETMAYTFWLSAGFWVFFFSRLGKRWRLGCAGVALIAAMQTRPDGALLFAFANVCLLMGAITRKVSIRNLGGDLAALNAAFVLVGVPVMVWKLSYYGDVVPNTYYAKAAYLSNYPQGFFYIGLFAWVYPTVVLSLGAFGLGAFRYVRWGRAAGWRGAAVRLLRSRERAAALTAMGVVVLYSVFFVAKVGGDFMFARFLIPMLPFAYYGIEWAVRFSLRKRPRWAVALLLGLCVAFGLENVRRAGFFEPPDGGTGSAVYSGITDERAYYTAKSANFGTMTLIEYYRHVGRQLAPDFHGIDAVVLANTQNALVYYGQFETVIGSFGLTDAYIARQPVDRETLRERRPGHVQVPSQEYLARRGADVMILRQTRGLPEYQLALLTLRDGIQIRAELVTYEERFLMSVKERMGERFQYVDFKQYLDAYVKNELGRKSRREVEEDYRHFFYYYFYSHPGTAWEQAIRERVGRL